MADDLTGHVLDEDGVTEAPFKRSGAGYVNTGEIVLRPGAVLDVAGMTLTNGPSAEFTYTLHQTAED